MNLVFYVSATDSFNMKDHSEIIFARPNSAADMTCSWSRLHKNTFGPFSIFVVLGAMHCNGWCEGTVQKQIFLFRKLTSKWVLCKAYNWTEQPFLWRCCSYNITLHHKRSWGIFEPYCAVVILLKYFYSNYFLGAQTQNIYFLSKSDVTLNSLVNRFRLTY